jgi:hypothetical protein
MQLVCPSCARSLDYAGERPRFCAFCGHSLSTVAILPAEPAGSEDQTIAPSDPGASRDALAVTEPPDTVEASASASGPLGRGVPVTVGGYRLVRRLGGGGMGAVYEAEEITSGRPVALKLIQPEIAGSGEALVRFRQEGRLASSVAHPRCVFVLAADEAQGRPYIVMELMPGSTLSDLVRERGPLPVEEAVAKILDVIDGLAEAHRLGLVHRDVKPSNCFLEASGRVKIGDFGLARSLLVDARLTRTDAFVGTPLYAAPEQIHKKEPTDAQSDVYSVAATLYFLLTGQAPFEGGDAMSTLARIITDDAPPMRRLRPELPRGLDTVVQRGLQRDRRRRYRDLDELRRALLVFLPAQPSVGGLGLRIGAGLIDFVARTVVSMVLAAVVIEPAIVLGALPKLDLARSFALYIQPLRILTAIVYYGVFEGIWGCGLGKWLLRLRVGTTGSVQPPGFWRAAFRGVLFYLVFQIAWLWNELLPLLVDAPVEGMPPERFVLYGLANLIGTGLFVLGLAVIFSTMRARNGYRALYEFLSGTRTYRLRWPEPRPRSARAAETFQPELMQPAGLPEQVGSFRVLGALRWTDRQRLLLAEDAQLGRAVWLWLRPGEEPPLATLERDASRATRLRWVSCGADGTWQWDTFVAPTGAPLPLLSVGERRLTWGDVRPILEELLDELQASCAEGSLPAVLAPDQVWVHRDGRVQLVTMPLADAEPADDAVDDQARALHLLGQVAVTALEGRPRPIGEAGDRVRAPLPSHASDLLDRLLGGEYRTLEKLRQDFEAVRDRPAQVDRLRRAGHLALSFLLMHVPLFGPAPATLLVISFIALWVTCRYPEQNDDDLLVLGALTGLGFAFWVVWALVFRGGIAYWRGGIALRRADGRKAARWQCALRALLVWGPLGTLYCLALSLAYVAPNWPWAYFGLWGLATALLPLYAILALLNPARSLHDRVAGTYLVPS